MRVSQLTKLISDKDDEIVIDDENESLEKMNLYTGAVRGIKRDDPINKLHITSICAYNDTILVLVARKERD